MLEVDLPLPPAPANAFPLSWLCWEHAQKKAFVRVIWAAGLPYIITRSIHYTLKLIWDEGLRRL